MFGNRARHDPQVAPSCRLRSVPAPLDGRRVPLPSLAKSDIHCHRIVHRCRGESFDAVAVGSFEVEARQACRWEFLTDLIRY